MAWDAIASMVGGEKISIFRPSVGGMLRFVAGVHPTAFAHSLRRGRSASEGKGSVPGTWLPHGAHYFPWLSYRAAAWDAPFGRTRVAVGNSARQIARWGAHQMYGFTFD